MSDLDADVRLTLGTLDLEVALQVAAGEVVAVLGPNGAGKTTLLRAIAGLEPLAAGHVTLGGRSLEDPAANVRVGPADRSVGLVFQDYLLFPHMSALDNVAFGPRARGASAAQARAAALGWLERVGLRDAAGTRPRALSGGQQQRVALARAFVTDPALLLLDEPLAALDIEARQDVRRDLRRHLDEFAGACVVVTHDPLEALTLAERLVIVESGRVTQEGAVTDVTRRPRSPWVARLVGVNLLRGQARGTLIDVGGAQLVSATPAQGAVFAVVHPRAVALHRREPEGTPRNVWAARVRSVDGRGDHLRVDLDAPLPLVAEVTAAAVAELDLGAGGQVWAAVKATEVDVYPA